MQNLVTLAGDNNKPVTTSKMIAEVFEKRHDHVLRDIESLAGGIPNFGETFQKTTYIHEQNGQEYPMYYITRDGFSLLAMGFTGQKALEWKVKYIEAFNNMEQQLNTPELQMAQGILAAQRLIEQKDKLIKEMKPKALFADAVASSQTSILVGELAKLLKQNGIDIGQQRLFTWLRENGYLIRRNGSDWNMPTQRAMEQGLFEIKESNVQNPDGSIRITRTPKVTGRGQVFFVTKFIEHWQTKESE